VETSDLSCSSLQTLIKKYGPQNINAAWRILGVDGGQAVDGGFIYGNWSKLKSHKTS
jgi:hypothetical protein